MEYALAAYAYTKLNYAQIIKNYARVFRSGLCFGEGGGTAIAILNQEKEMMERTK